MKLWPSRQGFLRNSLRLKLHLSVAFSHVQMTFLEIQSDFTDQFFDILKLLFSFSSQRHSVTLGFFKISLKKRSLLMAPFFIFHDAINTGVSGQQIIHQSRESLNYFVDRHHFTMGIAGPNINCMPCVELEISGGEGIYVSSILTIASFLGLFACTQRVRKDKKDKIT